MIKIKGGKVSIVAEGTTANSEGSGQTCTGGICHAGNSNHKTPAGFYYAGGYHHKQLGTDQPAIGMYGQGDAKFLGQGQRVSGSVLGSDERGTGNQNMRGRGILIHERDCRLQTWGCTGLDSATYQKAAKVLYENLAMGYNYWRKPSPQVLTKNTKR